MIWSAFKSRVYALLITNADRMGAEEYVPEALSAALLTAQRFVPEYRTGHETLYGPGSFTLNGEASVGTLPDGDMEEAYLTREESLISTERQCITYDWKDRLDLTNAKACLNDGFPRIAVDPRGKMFFIHPKIRPAGGFVSGDNLILPGTLYAGFLYAPEAVFPSFAAIDIAVVAGSTYRLTFGANEVAWQDGTLSGAALVYNTVGGTFVAYSDTLTIHGTAIGLNVTAQLFLVDSEEAPTVDDQLSIFWNGFKSQFSPNDDTPFDEILIEPVAAFINRMCATDIDQNLQVVPTLDRVFMRAMRSIRTYKKNQRKFKL